MRAAGAVASTTSTPIISYGLAVPMTLRDESCQLIGRQPWFSEGVPAAALPDCLPQCMRQTGVVTFNGGFADAQIQALQCYFVKVLREWAAHRQDAVEEQDAASTIGRLVFVTLAWLLSGLSLVLLDLLGFSTRMGFFAITPSEQGDAIKAEWLPRWSERNPAAVARVCRLLTFLQKVWLHEPLSFLDRRHGLLSISALRFAAVQVPGWSFLSTLP